MQGLVEVRLASGVGKRWQSVAVSGKLIGRRTYGGELAMIYNNPRTFRCTKPDCDCNGRKPLRLHCDKHPEGEIEALADGFSLHLRCLVCKACIRHLRLFDPGHNQIEFEMEESCSCNGDELAQ